MIRFDGMMKNWAFHLAQNKKDKRGTLSCLSLYISFVMLVSSIPLPQQA